VLSSEGTEFARTLRMTRRIWLLIGVFGLVVSAASRVTAAVPAQVEAEAYAGSSVGTWTCGPTARASYGGVGAQARIYTSEQESKRRQERGREAEREAEEQAATRELQPDPEPEETGEGATEGPPEPPRVVAESEESMRQLEIEETPDLEPHGFSVGAGGGGEYRSFTRLACADDPCGKYDVLPPSRLLGGGRLNFGYDWDYFGVRAGALAFQYWPHNTDSSPTNLVLPDVDFRFGRRAGFHGGFGFGAYDVATIFRPGAYLSTGYGRGRFAGDVRGGAHLAFDGEVGFRVDASARYAVTPFLAPGFGLALSGVKEISPEGRIFLVLTP
jgi:hypothetical protein